MYKEDFISYETAKKLKEACFDWTCQNFRIEKIPETEREEWDEDECQYATVYDIVKTPIPTLWQAAKWLREVKGIDITISVYREIDGTVSPRIIKRSYECEITTEDDEDYIPYSENEKDFPSYEAALSAGIDVALDLITNKTE